MEIVQVLSVDEEVQHVVSLATNLQACFHPVNLRGLEELGSFQGLEQALLSHGFRWTMLQLVKHEAFEELLVGNADFRGLARRAMLQVPKDIE